MELVYEGDVPEVKDSALARLNFDVDGTEKQWVVGRGAGNQVVLYSSSLPSKAKAAVSRQHAVIRYVQQDGAWHFVVSDGANGMQPSTNGTLVNGAHIPPAPPTRLTDGDLLNFGGGQGENIIDAFLYKVRMIHPQQQQNNDGGGTLEVEGEVAEEIAAPAAVAPAAPVQPPAPAPPSASGSRASSHSLAGHKRGREEDNADTSMLQSPPGMSVQPGRLSAGSGRVSSVGAGAGAVMPAPTASSSSAHMAESTAAKRSSARSQHAMDDLSQEAHPPSPKVARLSASSAVGTAAVAAVAAVGEGRISAVHSASKSRATESATHITDNGVLPMNGGGEHMRDSQQLQRRSVANASPPSATATAASSLPPVPTPSNHAHHAHQASHNGSLSQLHDLAHLLTCGFCGEMLRNAVGTVCGHTFCRGCFDGIMRKQLAAVRAATAASTAVDKYPDMLVCPRDSCCAVLAAPAVCSVFAAATATATHLPLATATASATLSQQHPSTASLAAATAADAQLLRSLVVPIPVLDELVTRVTGAPPAALDTSMASSSSSSLNTTGAVTALAGLGAGTGSATSGRASGPATGYAAPAVALAQAFMSATVRTMQHFGTAGASIQAR